MNFPFEEMLMTAQASPRGFLRSAPDNSGTPKFAVQHYTVAEIANLWKLSEESVRKLFEKEPDVLVFGNQKPRFGRRRYLTFRIPEFVVERVHRRLSRS
jgi:hypothetical protein